MVTQTSTEPQNPEPDSPTLEAELDRLVAEAQAAQTQAPQGQAVIYARYSTDFQDSTFDQIRACLEEATRLGLHVPRNHICYDRAVTGRRRQRPGLDRVRQLLRSRQATVLIALATNRLFRNQSQFLQFIEEEIREPSLRAIFPRSNIDTANAQNTALLLSFQSLIDETATTAHVAHIQEGHLGLFDRGLVTGTWPFGYKGEAIPGEYTRQGRPRQRLVVDPETGPWVDWIFRRFVEDGWSIQTILKTLNQDPDGPRPPRSQTGRWTYVTLRRLLQNPIYRGLRHYGQYRTQWLSRKDYAKKIAREEPLRTVQDETLRIVEDATWFAAQERLSQNQAIHAGRRARTAPPQSRLLSGLLYCPEHERTLVTGGAHGRYLVCPDCQTLPAEQRTLYSMLPRAWATQHLCEHLAQAVRATPDLVDRIQVEAQQAWARLARPDPESIRQCQRRIQRAEDQIQLLIDEPGTTEADRHETAARLRQARADRSQAQAELAQRQAAAEAADPPTAATIQQALDRLGQVLAAAGAPEAAPEDHDQAREALRLLLGGRLDLYQCGQRRPYGGWLQGRGRLQLGAAVAGLPEAARDAEGLTKELIIDFRPPTDAEQLAETVWDLYQAGWTVRAIADHLERPRNLISRALDIAYQRRGLQRPDGRSRRRQLAH